MYVEQHPPGRADDLLKLNSGFVDAITLTSEANCCLFSELYRHGSNFMKFKNVPLVSTVHFRSLFHHPVCWRSKKRKTKRLDPPTAREASSI